MPDSYTGTPIITLIGPGKSIDLNGLDNIRVNRNRVTLREGADAMFGSALSISNFEVRRIPGSPWKGYLSGTGFAKDDQIFVNGLPVANPQRKSATLFEVDFKVPADDTLNVVVVRDKQVVSKSFPNPAVVKVTSTTVIDFTPAVNKKKVKKQSVLLLKMNGVGFTSDLEAIPSRGVGKVLSTSPTEAIVEVRDAELPVVVTLRDKNTCITASGVAPKPPKEPKETKEKETKPPDKPKTEPETKPKEEAEQKPPKPKKE
jgi:hypothetical protein